MFYMYFNKFPLSFHFEERVLMQCPDLSTYQSLHKGQKRLDHAVDSLGVDVINRILVYSLYVFGYTYDFISNITGLSEPGLKTLVHEINVNGVERFQDKRRKGHIGLKKSNMDTADVTTVEYHESDSIYAEFETAGSVTLKIRKDDVLGKKLLAILFMEADLLKQKDVGEIMDCQRLAVRQNLLRFRSSGTKGLLDNRRGQKGDYKFNNEVQAEIIKKFISSVFELETPTKTNIAKHLNETFSRSFSERATALHLKKLGLIDKKRELISEIVRWSNERIDLLEYLEFDDKPLGAKHERHIGSLRRVKEGLIDCCLLSERMESTFFEIEKQVETFQSQLQTLVLESVLKEAASAFSQCPKCRSSNVVIYESDHGGERRDHWSMKTSLGSSLFLRPNMLPKGKCDNCGSQFDIAKDYLKLSEKNKFSPLTQMKICSANRAGSYENAVKNLSELLNLDINKNQIRTVSNCVGKYINDEFDELYKEISMGIAPNIISQRHPLVEELEIDEKYLNPSRYLIVLSVDGGRMQLFDWIPPKNDQSNGKKKLYWHETKVFRISIYDKANLCNISGSIDSTDEKRVYQSARIMPGLSTYGATNRKWEETGPLIVSHLYMRGIRPKNIEVCISDGSDHILKKILLPFFPKANHILDYYHKSEALHKCLKSVGSPESEIHQKLKNFLWKGQIAEIIANLEGIQSGVGKPDKGRRKTDDPKVVLDNFINHLNENEGRLQYKKYRSLKFPIGSGSVESAVKLFGKRIKGTEKQWSDGEPILHLYAFLLSEDERWNKLWEVHNPWM